MKVETTKIVDPDNKSEFLRLEFTEGKTVVQMDVYECKITVQDVTQGHSKRKYNTFSISSAMRTAITFLEKGRLF